MDPNEALDVLLKLEAFYSRRKIAELLNTTITTVDRWLYLETIPPNSKQQTFASALQYLKSDLEERTKYYDGFTYYHKLLADLETRFTCINAERSSSVERAKKYLNKKLPALSKDIINEARRFGISRTHVYAAAKELSVNMDEIGKGRGKKSYWSLLT